MDALEATGLLEEASSIHDKDRCLEMLRQRMWVTDDSEILELSQEDEVASEDFSHALY